MTKVLVVLFLFLGFISAVEAQKRVAGTIKGKLQDTLFKESMAEATVSVLNAVDSTVVAFGLANSKGEFEIKDIDTGSYRVLITFQGYRNISKNISINNNSTDVDLGTLHMDKKSVLLEEVVVERAPISVKKDTVEFSASAFKTKPNATAEDLLKKLPGVQVDKEGNVKAQGEDVQKVVVDGKEFFGNDPKLATKNITADMIESVQVFDDMSDQAKFTRIDDGSRQKTVNIKLKKNRRKGYFGRALVGGGTDGRYESSINFNRFDGDRRISVLFAANNLNKQGFSFSDIVGSMGGFGSQGGGGGRSMQMSSGRGGGGGFGGFGGGGGGITKSLSTGLNYTDKWGTKFDVTGSYFFSQTENQTQRSSLRQTFFPDDSIAIQSQETNSRNKNQNHRFNFRVEYYIDSMNSLLYTPSFTIQHSESRSFDTTFTRATKPGLDYKAITGFTANTNQRDGISLSNNLLYRRKFRKTGRTFTLGINNSLNNSEGNGTNYSPLVFYNPDGSVNRIRNQDLRTTQETRSNNNIISSSYTEPIGKNKLVELNYAYTNNHSISDRKAYNYDSSTTKYDQVNIQQTNYFENDFIAHRAGANFRVQTPKYNFQLGAAVQISDLTSNTFRAMTGKDTVLKQSFTNFFPTANFNYTFVRGKNLRINYRGRTNQPSISQLQNVPDYSNPLQIRSGNPSLQPEFSNNVNINYNSFNVTTFKFFSANINLGKTNNKIVNSIDTIGRNIQFIQPINLNGAFNASSFVTFGIPLKNKLKGSNVNFNTSLSYNRDVSEVYKQKNFTNNFIATQSAGINLDFKEKLNFGVNASASYNSAKYSVEKDLNSEYFSQTYSVDINYTMLKNLILSTDFDYYINSGRAEGYNQTLPLWSASIARQLFKKKNGEIKFSVNDILNQNRSINRTIGDNYIEDTRTVVLKRYFLLSFTYNLNRSGANQQPAGMQMPRQIQRQMERMRN